MTETTDATTPEPGRRIQVGNVEFWPEQGLVRAGHRELTLSPRLRDLLTMLMENAGGAVTFDRLLETSDHGRAVLAEDVGELKAQLGETAMISEVPNRGYRFEERRWTHAVGQLRLDVDNRLLAFDDRRCSLRRTACIALAVLNEAGADGLDTEALERALQATRSGVQSTISVLRKALARISAPVLIVSATGTGRYRLKVLDPHEAVLRAGDLELDIARRLLRSGAMELTLDERRVAALADLMRGRALTTGDNAIVHKLRQVLGVMGSSATIVTETQYRLELDEPAAGSDLGSP